MFGNSNPYGWDVEPPAELRQGPVWRSLGPTHFKALAALENIIARSRQWMNGNLLCDETLLTAWKIPAEHQARVVRVVRVLPVLHEHPQAFSGSVRDRLCQPCGPHGGLLTRVQGGQVTPQLRG